MQIEPSIPRTKRKSLRERHLKVLQEYIAEVGNELITEISRAQIRGLHAAVRDALHFYDRATGTKADKSAEAPSEGGWVSSEVLRLEEIRNLVWRGVV